MAGDRQKSENGQIVAGVAERGGVCPESGGRSARWPRVAVSGRRVTRVCPRGGRRVGRVAGEWPVMAESDAQCVQILAEEWGRVAGEWPVSGRRVAGVCPESG